MRILFLIAITLCVSTSFAAPKPKNARVAKPAPSTEARDWETRLPMKYSAFKTGEDCYRETVMAGSPLVVGVSRLQKSWTLRLNYPSYSVKNNLKTLTVKSLNTKTNEIDIAKSVGAQDNNFDASVDYLYEIPVPKKIGKDKMLQTSLIIEAQLENRVDKQSIVVYLVPLKSEMRIYDMTNACFISNPPEITDDVKVHRSATGPQDVEVEQTYSAIDENFTEKSLGILELSWYAGYTNPGAVGANQGRLADKRYRAGYSVSYYKKEEYREKLQHDFGISYTFQVNPGYVGYVVPMHEDQYIPYKDVQFNKCGQVKLTGNFDKTERRIRSSYQMVSVEPKFEGNLDYVFKKINKEFKNYNTCRENTHESITSDSGAVDFNSAKGPRY